MEHTKTMCGNTGFLLCVTVKGAGTYMYTLEYSVLLHRNSATAACHQLEQSHFRPS